MNVSSITSIINPYLNALQGASVQSTQDFKMLESALQSGSLATAQNAFSTFEQHLQARVSGGSQPFTSQSAAAKDWQALSAALQSGDLTAALSAFSSFKQDLQAPAPGGRPASGAPHGHKGARLAGTVPAARTAALNRIA